MTTSDEPLVMEAWRDTWRRGFAPLLSTEALRALERALVTDDSRLMQGGTTKPPPLQCVRDWPCEAACGTAYGPWLGDGLSTVAEVEEAFATLCFECDKALGEPAGCRWFLNFWDETPRDELFRLVLPEVRRALALRRESDESPNGSADAGQVCAG